jgi:multisubunit Na+/H+ antiporter MnhB subunit
MERRDRSLLVANVVFLVAMALHALDHELRGTGDLTTEVMVGGTVLGVMALATLPLTLTRHPRAPLAAAVVGLWTVVAVCASHLAPHWSAFSDPYPDQSLGFWSWAAMLGEVGAALVFGLVGLRLLLGAPAARAGTVPADVAP